MKSGGYVHPFTDFGFKKIFGEQSSLVSLRAFLNALLPEEHQIATLEFHKNEFSGRTARERRAVYDLYCKSSEGVSFIVELQKQKQTYFKDRSLYYTTFPIQQQALQGEWDFKLQPVYCIGVLDFRFDDQKTAEVVHRVRLKDQNNEVFIDKLNFIFLEIPNFTLTLEECQTSQDKWLYALKHMHALEEVPEEFESVEGLPEAFELAAMPMMSDLEFAAYQDSLKVYRDLRNVLDTAKREGREEMQAEVELAQAEAEQAQAEAGEAKVKAEQAEAEAGEAKAKAKQAEVKAEQAEVKAEQALAEAKQAKSMLEQGVAKLMENGLSEASARQMLGL